MSDFDLLKAMEQNAVIHRNDIILADDTTTVTYGRFYELTGRVYAYLKARNIGREDFVLLCLPRGVQPLIAMGGVLRAGAAFVIVEDNYAPERIAYITKGCGCRLVIDAGVWEEIQRLPARDGYEPLDAHYNPLYRIWIQPIRTFFSESKKVRNPDTPNSKASETIDKAIRASVLAQISKCCKARCSSPNWER